MIKTIEIKERSIRQLFRAFLSKADMFSFIIREEDENSEDTNQLLTELSNYLIEKKIVNEWPGTKLLLGSASFFKYHLNENTICILANYNDNIFEWIAPYLPEDLILYKNKIPILISITHERELYIELNDDINIKSLPGSLFN